MNFLKTTIISTILFSFTATLNAHNIFDDIRSAETGLSQNKYTLVYLYTSWCGGSKMAFDALSVSLLKNRDRFNFVVLTDSISYKELSEKIKSLKPDAFVLMDKYFKKRSSSIKEATAIGAQFIERYDYEVKTTMLASGNFYLEFPNQNLMKLFVDDNATRLDNYLSSIPVCQ